MFNHTFIKRKLEKLKSILSLISDTMKLILWDTLTFEIQSDVQIKDLGDTTIFAENLGTTKLYHKTWRLILGIDTLNLETQFSQILETYSQAIQFCDQCSVTFELKLLKNRLKRLKNAYVSITPNIRAISYLPRIKVVRPRKKTWGKNT